MTDMDIKRKLATILVADIVGYSRLTANDEDWTIRALGEFRKVVDDIIERHDGRIFSTGGDSVLAEFASPVEAVRAAVDFQEAALAQPVAAARSSAPLPHWHQSWRRHGARQRPARRRRQRRRPA
jgi:class 3 adenylate cyclase